MDLKSIYLEEINQLEHIGLQFLNGDLSRADFKKVSGGLGVYSESCGTRFMVRLRIPSGIASLELLQNVGIWANTYNLNQLHFTTRQTIQFHSLTLSDAINLLKEALDFGIMTKGAGGDFPRNVSFSPLSGVSPSEPFDTTPYAVMLNTYFIERMPTYKLPRKLKMGVSNTLEDTAHATIQDMGFIAVLHDNKPHFKLYIGGGLGKTPSKAILYPQVIPASDFLYYVEALVNLFLVEGDYTNKQKARVRYIIERLGEEAFIKLFDEYLQKTIEKTDLRFSPLELPIAKQGLTTDLDAPRLTRQKQNGLYSVYVHPVAGQLATKDFSLLMDTLADMESVSVRLALEESFYIINLTGPEAEKVIALTHSMTGHTQINYSVACVGKPICQLGILESQKLLSAILKKLEDELLTKDLLPPLHISGCGNSCGTHHIGMLGFAGKKMRIANESVNVYQCFVNGYINASGTKLAQLIGEIKECDIPDFIVWLYKQLEENRESYTEWIPKNIDQLKNQCI